MLWKVPTVILLPLSPTTETILSFISLAALFVKVVNNIFEGSIPLAIIYWALAIITLVLPAPAVAVVSAGPFICLTAVF